MQVQNYGLFDKRCEEQNLTCGVCSEPYKTPQSISKCLHVFCKTCVEPLNNCPQCRTAFKPKNLKHDFDKEARVEKIRQECLAEGKQASQEVVQETATHDVAEKMARLDVKDTAETAPKQSVIRLHDNHMEASLQDIGNAVLTAIEEGHFDDVLNLLDQVPNNAFLHKLEGPSKLCLIKASANPSVPQAVIERLLDKGLNQYVPENPKDWGSDFAVLPIGVAAREGNVTAIKVFLDRKLYGISQLHNAAQIAISAGQIAALNLIFSQQCSFAIDCKGSYTTETVAERFDASAIVQHAEKTQNRQLLQCARNHFPDCRFSERVLSLFEKEGIVKVR